MQTFLQCTMLWTQATITWKTKKTPMLHKALKANFVIDSGMYVSHFVCFAIPVNNSASEYSFIAANNMLLYG